jgi:hypothetical protein
MVRVSYKWLSPQLVGYMIAWLEVRRGGIQVVSSRRSADGMDVWYEAGYTMLITRRWVHKKNNAQRLVAHSSPQPGSSRRRWERLP